MTSVGVIGASGVGAVHVRELLHTGVQIAGVLGRTADTSRATARKLSDRFGVPIPAFPDLATFLDSDMDAVVVATPAETHAEFVLGALAAGKYVLCEKPLVWPPPGAAGDGEEFLVRVEDLGGERLALNFCNAFLLEPARRGLALPEKPQHFRFEFFSRGPHTGVEVGVDLLPHALSLLQHLEPGERLDRIHCQLRGGEFQCRFRCGRLDCEFILREDPAGPKRLAFGLDEVMVVRSAGTFDGPYRIQLYREDMPDRLIDVPDPIASTTKDFLHGIETGTPFTHGFAKAAENFRWMRSILQS